MKTYPIFRVAFLTIAVMVMIGCVPRPETAVLPTSPSTATIEPTTLPAVPHELLPHSFFYLSKDSAGVEQVYRIKGDGKTVTQLTFEDTGVTDYDVSLVDGRVVYVANNQLLLILADGSNRRVLLDGGPRDSNYWVSKPVFFPFEKVRAISRICIQYQKAPAL